MVVWWSGGLALFDFSHLFLLETKMTQYIDDDYDYQDYLDDTRNDPEIDEYVESRGGIDKCMCCGKYKYNDELTYPGQTCLKGCSNPNEY